MKHISINDPDPLHDIKFPLMEGSGEEERKKICVNYMTMEAAIAEIGDDIDEKSENAIALLYDCKKTLHSYMGHIQRTVGPSKSIE